MSAHIGDSKMMKIRALAQKILNDKRNVSEPGAGYYIVRIPGRESVSGHFDQLEHKVMEALMAPASVMAV